jgi:hypothetical protein
MLCGCGKRSATRKADARIAVSSGLKAGPPRVILGETPVVQLASHAIDRCQPIDIDASPTLRRLGGLR